MENKGLTLIEAVISLFLITVGLVSFFSFFQKIINYNSVTSSRLIAAYLAQEGIEITRNIRDNYWLDPSTDWFDFTGDVKKSPYFCDNGCKIDYNDSFFSNYNGEYLKIDGNGFYSYDSGIDTKFKRKIKIEEIVGVDAVKVIVEVSWTDKGQNYQILVQENLYKWWAD